jgi:hypothetical protein
MWIFASKKNKFNETPTDIIGIRFWSMALKINSFLAK